MSQSTDHATFLCSYHSEQYDYFLNKGYGFYLVNSNGSDWVYAFTNEELVTFEKNLTKKVNKLNTIPLPINSKKDYFKFMKQGLIPALFDKHILQHQNEQPGILFDIFIHFFQKHPEYHSVLINNYKEVNNLVWGSKHYYFNLFVDQCTTTFKQATTLLFNIDCCGAYDISHTDLVSLLEKKKGTHEQIDLFLIQFYKSKEKSLNSASSFKLRDFLLERNQFSQDALSPYFSFFKSLNHYFNPPPIDIFVEKSHYSISSVVDTHKISTSFSIDGYAQFDYDLQLQNFVKSFTSCYSLTRLIDTKTNDNKELFTIFHDNPLITKEFFETKIVQFFSFLSHNPEIDIDDNLIKAWLRQSDLNDSLKSNEKTVSKKTKI